MPWHGPYPCQPRMGEQERRRRFCRIASHVLFWWLFDRRALRTKGIERLRRLGTERDGEAVPWISGSQRAGFRQRNKRVYGRGEVNDTNVEGPSSSSWYLAT